MHFVENDSNGTHFHYREADRVHRGDLKCGFASHNSTTRVRRDIQHRDEENEIVRGKGGKFSSKTGASSSIKGPWNANSRSRYVELLLVVDHKEYLGHGEDLNKIYRICKV